MATPGRYRRQDVFYKNVTQDGDFILLFFGGGDRNMQNFFELHFGLPLFINADSYCEKNSETVVESKACSKYK